MTEPSPNADYAGTHPIVKAVMTEQEWLDHKAAARLVLDGKAKSVVEALERTHTDHAGFFHPRQTATCGECGEQIYRVREGANWYHADKERWHYHAAYPPPNPSSATGIS